MKGASSQEKSLCRLSTLYPCLLADTALPFYDTHHRFIETGKMSRKNNYDCIYTPDVIVFRNDDFKCEELT